jgi:hypothetical protein
MWDHYQIYGIFGEILVEILCVHACVCVKGRKNYLGIQRWLNRLTLWYRVFQEKLTVTSPVKIGLLLWTLMFITVFTDAHHLILFQAI